jgi:hypothetical protein
VWCGTDAGRAFDTLERTGLIEVAAGWAGRARRGTERVLVLARCAERTIRLAGQPVLQSAHVVWPVVFVV